MKHRFEIRDKCQTASGGSYIVKYSAELSTSPGSGELAIRVANTIPELADDELMKRSVEQIQLGVAEVLEEQRLDGTLIVSDLVIHDVDCKPYKFRKPTSEAVRGLRPLS